MLYRVDKESIWILDAPRCTVHLTDRKPCIATSEAGKLQQRGWPGIRKLATSLPNRIGKRDGMGKVQPADVVIDRSVNVILQLQIEPDHVDAVGAQ